jgi:hypothetical protein
VGKDGLVAPRDYKAVVTDDTSRDRRDTRQPAETIEHGTRCTLETRENVCEVSLIVENVARRLHGGRRRYSSDKTRNAASHEEGNRHALVPLAPEVVQQLATKRPHQEISLGILR